MMDRDKVSVRDPAGPRGCDDDRFPSALGLDEFLDHVVPLLQERGTFRPGYTGPTLRHHLALPHPPAHRLAPDRTPASPR